MERGLLRGLAAYRWAAWGWVSAVLLISVGQLVAPLIAYALLAAALIVTIAHTWQLSSASERLPPALVVAEVAVGGALVAADGFVYGPGHAFSIAQSLGVAWPLAGVLTAGFAGGPWVGGAAGLLMGLSRVVAAAGNGVRGFGDDEVLSLATTAVLYLLAGTVSGYVTDLLRRAEREISAARTREEMAGELHDGVLQTLAVIERRASDPVLARLAREQERDLRRYIAGLRGHDAGLTAALHDAAARFEDAFGGRARIVISDDLAEPSRTTVEAVAGAVGEALTNAGKHGTARTATIFIEPDGDGLFCSVKDDGSGFDPASMTEGIGIGSSIRARAASLGGRAEVESRPGGPTEVRLWIP